MGRGTRDDATSASTSTPRRELYEVLGLEKSSKVTSADVRKAYHRLAKVSHPDKVRGDDAEKEAAKARFQEIGHAYSVLSDPEQRKEYDEIGMRMFEEPGAYDHFEAEQARMMYCEALGVRECVVRELWCDLEELFSGCVRREGVMVLGVDDVTRKVTQRSRVFTVRVHRGWREGFELKFMPTGNDLQSVMFVIRERPHERFDRVNNGRDVAQWIALEPRQALNGCIVTTRSISGREVKLAIKPNSHTIRKGEKKVIKGEGFYGQGTNERGDMVIYFRVMNPVETYLMQGTGWRMKWAKRVAVAVGIWIALNLAGELLLYYVEDMLLLRNIPDEFLLDQFPAHYGEFDTSWWWPVVKIPQKLAEDYTGANALASGLAHYHAAHAPSRALLRAIVKGGVMTRPRR
tara:strand:- start:9681 stop:10892 length:1212 start_codon:yes stop_codon:yes gene_type:complete